MPISFCLCIFFRNLSLLSFADEEEEEDVEGQINSSSMCVQLYFLPNARTDRNAETNSVAESTLISRAEVSLAANPFTTVMQALNRSKKRKFVGQSNIQPTESDESKPISAPSTEEESSTVEAVQSDKEDRLSAIKDEQERLKKEIAAMKRKPLPEVEPQVSTTPSV